MAKGLEEITRREWIDIIKEVLDASLETSVLYLNNYVSLLKLLEETNEHKKNGLELKYFYSEEENSFSYQLVGKKGRRKQIGFKYGENNDKN